MDALIMSCGTGGGHNSAAAAVKEELERRGFRVMLFDPYELVSKRLSRSIDQTYIGMVQRSPRAFGAMYRLGDMYRRLPWRSPIYQANARMAGVLQRYLKTHHTDVIVMTHLYPGEIVTQMRRRGMALPPTVFVTTDYTCTPFVEEVECDRYILPGEELRAEFVRRGLPNDRLLPYGIPVRRVFAEQIGRAEARAQLGLRPDGRYCLIFGGSMGAGQIPQILRLLKKHYGDTLHPIVICGNNQRLHDRLTERFGGFATILRFTDRVADYLRACDLVLSKPGGLSSTEAAVVGTALIHITPIPGCETINQRFFAKRGMSLPVNEPRRELLAACDRLLDEKNRAVMIDRQHRHIDPHAAEKIGALIEQLAADDHCCV